MKQIGSRTGRINVLQFDSTYLSALFATDGSNGNAVLSNIVSKGLRIKLPFGSVAAFLSMYD